MADDRALALQQNYAYWRMFGMTARAAWRAANDPAQPRRYGAWSPSIVYNSTSDGNVRWVENAADGLRFVGFADEILPRMRHKGWFTRSVDPNETYRGVVYSLPHGRYVAGYADPNNEGAALLCFDMGIDDKEQAAREADHFAERHADKEREYNDAWDAGADYRRHLDDARDLRRQFLAIRKLAPKGYDDAFLVRTLEELAAQWAHQRKEAADLLDRHRRYQRDAFREGAEL